MFNPKTVLLGLIILAIILLFFFGRGFLSSSAGPFSFMANPNLLKNVKDSGGGQESDKGGVTSGGQGTGASKMPSSDAKEFQECQKGKMTIGTTVTGGWGILGKESQVIGGKKVEVCCFSAVDPQTGQNLSNTEEKTCGTANDEIIYLKKVDGQFEPYLAGYKKDGKDCATVYDGGKVVSDQCVENSQ